MAVGPLHFLMNCFSYSDAPGAAAEQTAAGTHFPVAAGLADSGAAPADQITAADQAASIGGYCLHV